MRLLNLAAAFEAHVQQDPGAAALVIEDRRWSRGEIWDLAARARGMLMSLGVGPGDRVVAQYDTEVEDVALAVATAARGATLIPVPKRTGAREMNFLLERSGAKFFGYHAGELASVIVPPADAHVRSVASVVDAEPVYGAIADPGDDHVALIGMTSGSTGQPKGVMHGWSGVAWAAERMRALADVRWGESILVTGAGAGAPGFTFFTYLGLAHGVTIVRAARWNPPRVLQLARDNGCVWSTMVPTMLQMLLDARQEALGDGRLESMRAITVGGSFMSASLIRRARRELGVEVLRMYAMAECMSNASTLLSDTEEDRDTMDGRPHMGAELGVFDEGGEHVRRGEVGEVGLKGPSLLKGYLAEPEAKAGQMTRDGFFLSGDLGKFTPAGFIKIVGRKKDMIIRGGFNIDPSEVEELIKRHPAIAKVVVVGYPDEKFGERACAVVEPIAGGNVSLKSLTDHLLSLGLSKEKLPERLEIRAALPLSPDGKILKGKIRDEIGTNPAANAG
jgi:acyl-CoA synthetase